MRVMLIILMAAASVACTRGSGTVADRSLGPNHASAADSGGPMYASEAQRARAQYYWLPQNQLPADAGVQPPAPQVAEATAHSRAGIF